MESKIEIEEELEKKTSEPSCVLEKKLVSIEKINRKQPNTTHNPASYENTSQTSQTGLKLHPRQGIISNLEKIPPYTYPIHTAG